MADPWNVQCDLGQPEVLSDGAGRYTVYTLLFRIGTQNYTFQSRYRNLWTFNEKVSSFDFGGKRKNQVRIPKFPPKTWLSDMTKPKNYEKRAHELLIYFRDLIKHPSFLRWQVFHNLLELPEELRKQFKKIADDMESKNVLMQNIKTENVLTNKTVASSGLYDNKNVVEDQQFLLAKKRLEKDLKKILSSAEQSFMSAETNFLNNSQEITDEADDQAKEIYERILKEKKDWKIGELSIPPARTAGKTQENNLDAFEEALDKLLENFDVDLFPNMNTPIKKTE